MAPLLRFIRRRASTEREQADAAVREAPRIDRRRIPRAGQLRRERRMLLREREERIRDLGGLVLEMYRRDGFRDDLVLDQCADLVAVDTRLQELGDLLAVLAGRPPAHLGSCACGAPLRWGSHFCSNCGRPAASVPVIGCPDCGHALPADANFCALCGTPVAAEVWQASSPAREAGARPESARNGQGGQPGEA